jgi:MoCo/4Fe-4S cofactor protein with predicted Tat translocation signal
MSSMNYSFNQPSAADAVQRLTARSGKEYWRGLEEFVETESFQELIRSQFPEHAAQWSNALTRRQFLCLMGASLALAGVAGCSPQPPVGKIMPYVRQPEGMTLGKPQFYATAMDRGGVATGLLVKSHEGRPTKVEGNPNHPASLGATDVFAQATLLGLYDPDRSQSITYLGQPRGWSSAQLALRKALEAIRKNNGRGLRILTETISSPTLADQLAGQRKGSVAREFPEAKWYQYEPTHGDARLAGARLAFGEDIDTVYNFFAAEVIVSLDADFLAFPAAGLRYTRDVMNRRAAARDAKIITSNETTQSGMNRLYVAECMPTITGSVADHKLPLRPSEIQNLARALAAELGTADIQPPEPLAESRKKWVAAVAKDLQRHRGSSIVICGNGQPPIVHALAHAMNNVLGNVGRTVRYIEPIEARPAEQSVELRALGQEMQAGNVQLLLILAGNPVFTTPADLEFEKHLQNVPLRVHLGLYADETAAQCHWHIPEAHFLESWSDARTFDGSVSIIQPLIAPLYGGRSAHEVLSALVEEAERPGHELVRSYWRKNWPRKSNATDFDWQWEKTLHDGMIAETAFAPKQGLKLRLDWDKPTAARSTSTNSLGASQTSANSAQPASEPLEIVFQPDPTVFDGRFANNGWLQELPKPITKLTWDNAAFVSPALAEKLGLSQTFGSSGGEHGEALVDVVELTLHGRTLEAPIWILPGHADDCVTVHYGYGRTLAGKVGSGVGFNAYQLRTSEALNFGTGLTIRKLDKRFTLACTQMHHSMEGRAPVREGSFDEFVANPQFLEARETEEHRRFQRELVPGRGAESKLAEASDADGGSKPEQSKLDSRLQPLSLYPEYDYGPPKNKWGMSIDLTKCTGCSACVIACQAENNIPVVGKTEVTRGREMHWVRVDRYYKGDSENPATYFQPVPCMQCENAPCELVCPVGATVHSADGLNDMVYNRCVGTRYCSNNCPYKVRRFNFFEYADFHTESLKAGRNPEVTIRSRGVMEKCTYCVQRIRAGQIQAELAGRSIRDGDVETACQQACPARAIVFGDMNDTGSEVAKQKAEPLNYGLLAELNTRPRTTYVASLRNPNPELEST